MRTVAKIGTTMEFNMTARMRAASGAAKSMTNAGRHRCLGFEMISVWKSPNHGASKNHVMVSGTADTRKRGRISKPGSPWKTKPRYVTTAMARTSQRKRIRFDIVYAPHKRTSAAIAQAPSAAATATSATTRLPFPSSCANGSLPIADS